MKYSLNIFRWLRWVCLRIKYRNAIYKNYFAPKPHNKKYLLNELKKIEYQIYNHEFNFIPPLRNDK